MSGFRIILKSGHVDTDDAGRIVFDGSGGRAYSCQPSDSWRVLGIATRHHSNAIASLATCADNPARIGQGWVYDVDHGSVRLWAMPKFRRAVRVERL